MSKRPQTAREPVAPGLLLIDKPSGMTSHDVVSRVRRIMRTRKVGHAGTLDPMATGVLVLGLERATKLLGHLALDTKAYLATISLGVATTTDDLEGDVLESADAAAVSDVTEQAIEAAIAGLTGEIQQVPSAYSAVKINGKRAYELARAGESVPLEARPVTVSRLDTLAMRRQDSTIELDVLIECSSGTYVRALARDMGRQLGVGGHLAALRRTRVGPFGLATVRTLEQLESEPTLSMTLDDAVAAAFPRADVDARTARSLAYGQAVPSAGLTGEDTAGTYGMFGPDGHAAALVRDQGRSAKPVFVITPSG